VKPFERPEITQVRFYKNCFVRNSLNLSRDVRPAKSNDDTIWMTQQCADSFAVGSNAIPLLRTRRVILTANELKQVGETY